MANPHKGEVGFEVDGKAYKLSYSANALCELEDLMNLGVNEITARLQQVEKLRIKTVRAVFWAGLLDHQPGIEVAEAGRLLTILKLPRAVDLLSEAFSLAFPSNDKAGDAARPQTPDRPAGTGPASSKAA